MGAVQNRPLRTPLRDSPLGQQPTNHRGRFIASFLFIQHRLRLKGHVPFLYQCRTSDACIARRRGSAPRVVPLVAFPVAVCAVVVSSGGHQRDFLAVTSPLGANSERTQSARWTQSQGWGAREWLCPAAHLPSLIVRPIPIQRPGSIGCGSWPPTYQPPRPRHRHQQRRLRVGAPSVPAAMQSHG